MDKAKLIKKYTQHRRLNKVFYSDEVTNLLPRWQIPTPLQVLQNPLLVHKYILVGGGTYMAYGHIYLCGQELLT